MLVMHLPKVDFPLPDSPTIPSVSPLYMLKLTLSTAFKNNFFENNDLVCMGKYFFNPFTSTSFSITDFLQINDILLYDYMIISSMKVCALCRFEGDVCTYHKKDTLL